VLLRLPPVGLRRGETRFLYGRLRARNFGARPVLQQVGVQCDRGNWFATIENNRGARRRYRAGAGVLTLGVRGIFTAPNDGTYRCRLWARSSGERVHALPGETFLEMGRRDAPGASMAMQAACSRDGTRSLARCVYLVPASAEAGGFPERAAVLDLPLDTSGGTRTITAIADLQLTSCYRGTRSFPLRVGRFGGGEGSVAVVESRIDVVQYDLLGRAGTCTPRFNSDRDRRVRATIPHDTHHHKVHLRASFVPDEGVLCASRLLARVIVRAVAGDPIRVDGMSRRARAPVAQSTLIVLR
jgi:hypothetical protein